MIEVWEKMQLRGSDGVIRPLEDAQILDIEKPLARRADRFIAEHPEDRPIIERLFALRLIKILEQGNPFRRRVYEKDCSKAEWTVLNAMSAPQWRLVVTGNEQDVAFAEVAHDILLSKWPALKTLIARERQFLLWRTDTEREFNRWLETWFDAAAIPVDENARREFNISVFRNADIDKGDRELLRGARLSAATDTLAIRSDDIEPYLRQFIIHSNVVARKVEEPIKNSLSSPGSTAYRSDIKLSVFISYSRRDTHEVEALHGALAERGIEVYLDRMDISAGEEWQSRLGSLIASADAIVFVMSPDSVNSQTCAWELNECERLGKQIIPFMVRHVSDDRVPSAIRKLNYIVVDENRGAAAFLEATTKLERVLKADVAWLREYARLNSRAGDWQTASRPSNRLLSGSDVLDAQNWLENRPPSAPAVADLVRDFIVASNAFESLQMERSAQLEKIKQPTGTRGQVIMNRLMVASLVLAIALAAAGWGDRITRFGM
jgi:hypothetical protein